jgi:hypothetical protein
MALSKEILARMSDESRFPTDEVSAVVAKMLLQFCIETEVIRYIESLKEFPRNSVLRQKFKEIRAMQRELHVEFTKRHPAFKYASQVSYILNPHEQHPSLSSVDADGVQVPFETQHDLTRDAVLYGAIEYVLAHHLVRYEPDEKGESEYELTWEKQDIAKEVELTTLIPRGQLLN